MLPERTTTTGDSVPVKHINPFQIINAEDTIKPKNHIQTVKKSSFAKRVSIILTVQ